LWFLDIFVLRFLYLFSRNRFLFIFKIRFLILILLNRYYWILLFLLQNIVLSLLRLTLFNQLILSFILHLNYHIYLLRKLTLIFILYLRFWLFSTNQ
jgi:hypothetical protein